LALPRLEPASLTLNISNLTSVLDKVGDEWVGGEV
jgi:hypothetical protein